MHSFSDPLFSDEYLKPAPPEQTYLVSSNGLSIFDNPLLPTYEEISSNEKIHNFLQSEKGNNVAKFAKHAILISLQQCLISKGYFTDKHRRSFSFRKLFANRHVKRN